MSASASAPLMILVSKDYSDITRFLCETGQEFPMTTHRNIVFAE